MLLNARAWHRAWQRCSRSEGAEEKHKFRRQKVKMRALNWEVKNYSTRNAWMRKILRSKKPNRIYLNSFLIRNIPPERRLIAGPECWFRRKCKQSLNPSRYFYFAFLIFRFMTSWDSDAGICLNYRCELSAGWASGLLLRKRRAIMKPQKVWIIAEKRQGIMFMTLMRSTPARKFKPSEEFRFEFSISHSNNASPSSILIYDWNLIFYDIRFFTDWHKHQIASLKFTFLI